MKVVPTKQTTAVLRTVALLRTSMMHKNPKIIKSKGRKMQPWAGSQFQDENPVSYCTGRTSYFSM